MTVSIRKGTVVTFIVSFIALATAHAVGGWAAWIGTLVGITLGMVLWAVGDILDEPKK